MRRRTFIALAVLLTMAALGVWRFVRTDATAPSEVRSATPNDAESTEPATVAVKDELRVTAPLTESAQPETVAQVPALDASDFEATRASNEPLIVEVLVASEFGARPEVTPDVVWSRGNQRVVPPLDSQLFAPFHGFRCELAADVWDLHVEAEGFHPYDATLDFTGITTRGRRERVALLPIGFTVLRLRSSDGRSLTELADETGIDIDALATTGVNVWWSETGSPQNRSRVAWGIDRKGLGLLPVATLRNVVAGANVAGILSHAEAPGAWISLSIDENQSNWKYVESTQRDAVFELDFAVDDYRPATLTFRVVARGADAPPDETTARLEARSRTAHRPEFNGLPLDTQGAFTLDKLSPGDYTLVVQAPGYTEHRRAFTARFGEQVQLGELVLDVSRELEVRVRDADGRPLRARVHVGAFDAESRAPQSFSPRFEATDEQGIARIPPSTSDIVLRAVVSGAAGVEPLAGRSSRIVRVDPNQFVGRIEIVVSEPSLVEIASSVGEFVIENDVGVVVEKSLGSEWLGYLQPGTYRAIARDANDRVTAQLDFEVRVGAALSLELR